MLESSFIFAPSQGCSSKVCRRPSLLQLEAGQYHKHQTEQDMAGPRLSVAARRELQTSFSFITILSTSNVKYVVSNAA